MAIAEGARARSALAQCVACRRPHAAAIRPLWLALVCSRAYHLLLVYTICIFSYVQYISK